MKKTKTEFLLYILIIIIIIVKLLLLFFCGNVLSCLLLMKIERL